MFQWLASFLTPHIVGGFIDAYKARLAATNAEGAQAAELARAAMLAKIEARKSADAIIIAEHGRWWTALPRAIVQWSIALWVAKCVFWDTTLGLGTTEPLRGDIQEWAGWIMVMWFGGRSLEKIAGTIWSRRH